MATLGAWTLTGAPGASTFIATVRDHNPATVSQRPLVVVTPSGWRWDIVTLQIVGDALTATVRPQESLNGNDRQAEDRPDPAVEQSVH